MRKLKLYVILICFYESMVENTNKVSMLFIEFMNFQFFKKMILLDKPYISDYLKKTIIENQYPVVKTEYSSDLGIPHSQLKNATEVFGLLSKEKNPKIYTASENSIGWIAENLTHTELPEKINLFKDKVKFRGLLEELRNMDISQVPFPIILKPSVGFFSMGVYLVESAEKWEETVDSVLGEFEEIRDLYPTEVLDTNAFILEEIIEGAEFAVDAYFNAEGKPVVLNILEHLFASEDDVSDRVYYTSSEIITTHLESFTSFLETIGSLTGVKNFPVHLELRIDKMGNIQPIEINPMRFGGWCTTADLAMHAYGLNTYQYYLEGLEPDWEQLLIGKEGKLYSIVVLNNATGYNAEEIVAFDAKKMMDSFKKPMEFRAINHHEYPVFGFLFTETRSENIQELKDILASDLREYVNT